MRGPRLQITKELGLLQIKIFGAPLIHPEQKSRVALPPLHMGKAINRFPMLPIVPQHCWAFPPFLPHWQAVWPGPAYFGHPASLWSNPGLPLPASAVQTEPSVPDPCLDSAAAEPQDPHFDSQDQVQSPVTSVDDTASPGLVTSLISVEVHSVEVPSGSLAHSPLPSSSPRGASPSLPHVDINRQRFSFCSSHQAH